MKKFHVIAWVLLLAAALVLIQSLAVIRGLTAADGGRSKQRVPATQNLPSRARGSEEITLHAAGRGGPWINLQDGHDLMTSYTGTSGLESVMEHNEARPLALASGDFDEDGVPDLISGYGCAACSTNLSVSDGSGLITLHRGNVDAIYPNTAEAEQRKASGEFTDAPFLSPALVFEVSQSPDFVGAGDFDADGHLDVVMAKRGSSRLHWMAGDGHGGFGPAQAIELPGTVTKLVTGEMNRADGLADVIMGIERDTSVSLEGVWSTAIRRPPEAGTPNAMRATAGVLIFEGPEGALKHEPEVIALPTPARSLALGQLDDSYEMDLAVATGSDLVIVHGRDRRLSLEQEERAKVEPAKVELDSMPFTIASLAIGNFTRNDFSQVAALSADGVVHVVERKPTSKRWGKIVSEVATGSSSTDFSLRSQAETPTEVRATPELIRARVSVSGLDDLVLVDRGNRRMHVISHLSATDYAQWATDKQRVQNTEFRRAFSDSNNSLGKVAILNTLDVEGEPIAVLPMRLTPDALSDLVVLKNSGQASLTVASTVALRTFMVNNSGDQSDVNPGDGKCETVANNGVCTLRAAIQEVNAGPGGDAVSFSVSTTTSTGFGLQKTATVDGGTNRIEISGGGISIQCMSGSTCAGNSTIRGFVINRFSASPATAIRIDTNGGNNIIENNYIGTDTSGGSAALGNITNGTGVSISSSSNNTIGGTTAAARNVIVMPGEGVRIQGQSPGNKVQGNYIGTNAAGTSALAPASAVGVTANSGGNSPNQTVGGTNAGARNVIACKGANVALGGSGASGILVQGNLIGTDASGTATLTSPPANGVTFSGASGLSGFTVGGTSPAARNIISGHNIGVDISSVSSALVQGNYIGTDIFGRKALGNSVGVRSSADGVTIGGTTAGARNLISGNGSGINLTGPNSFVQGNYIGTDVNGTDDLGNPPFGVGVQVSGNNNKIGGTEGGASNIIAFNKNIGVLVGGTGNSVRRNSIFGNTQQGILCNTGSCAKRPTLSGTTGTLSGATPGAYTIEFFSNDTCGSAGSEQGKTFISEATATADASGNATFAVPTAQNVTATTSATGQNTSTISNCIAGATPTPTPTPSPQINLNRTELSFSANAGGQNPANQLVTLTNTGGSALNWQAASSDNWLGVTSPSGTLGTLAPNQSIALTVSATVGSLAALNYQGKITISSSNASNTPQFLNVTFNVAEVLDSIKIVPGTARVNGRTLDKVVISDPNVVFSCDVQYQLSDAFGSISLVAKDQSAKDLSGSRIVKTLDKTIQPAEKATEPKTKHLSFVIHVPQVSLEKYIPLLTVDGILLNSTGNTRSSDSIAFDPQDWLLIDDAKANNETAYARDQAGRGAPTPDVNNKINMVLKIRYRLNSSPNGNILVLVSDENGLLFNRTFPIAGSFEADTIVQFSFDAASVLDSFSKQFTVSVSQMDANGQAIQQSAQKFNSKIRPEPPNAVYPFNGTRRMNLSSVAPTEALYSASAGTINVSPSASLDITGNQLTPSPSTTLATTPPDLIDLIAPGSSNGNTFVTEIVDGLSTTVLKFPLNNGLALLPTTNTIPNNVYTVVMLLKFDEANKARRILDFKNGASDNGLYASADNRLRFNPSAIGANNMLTAGSYVQVALSRDANGVVTGYVNGSQQFQFTDTNNDAVIDSNNTLRFFQDNLSGGNTGEASAGSIARLRLYGRALPAAEIAALDREPSSVQFSAANYSVSEGAGFTTITVTRAGATSLPATVDYITSDETAKQPLDYTIASGTLSFAAGETSKTFQVQITDNGLVDLDRQLVLFLQNPNGVTLESQSVAVLTISDNETAPTSWESVALTAGQAEIKTWTVGGRTYAYLKLLFPNAGYRVTNWGQAVRAGNDFTADAAVEKFTGPSVQAVTTTAGIYDLGTLPPGSYNFTFKNTGTVVKTLAFTVAAPPFPANPIDTAREFVKQQYRDFLNREADPAGENFWTDNITKCSDPARRPAGQTEAQCTLRQRETTSGAFFLSPEFQYTGYFVYRMYQGALGRQPKLSEFIPDAQFVGAGVLVNSQLSAGKINQNKADFAVQFVNCTDATKSRCAEFKAIYDGLNNQQYVDQLFQTTGATPTTSERAALVNGLNAIPATETRATVLQKVVDGIFVISEGNQRFDTTYGQAFYNSEFNRAFVQLQYFGYMKRDPDDAGYAFWLGKLNQFGGNFVNAEMVLAFISSPEYRARFGQP